MTIQRRSLLAAMALAPLAAGCASGPKGHFESHASFRLQLYG